MSLPVVLHREARLDVEKARDYFDEQHAGLGQAFLDRLNELLSRIGMFPELYGIAWRTVRSGRLRRFPYVVYYRINADRIEVLAVMHGRRDASAWQSRV